MRDNFFLILKQKFETVKTIPEIQTENQKRIYDERQCPKPKKISFIVELTT